VVVVFQPAQSLLSVLQPSQTLLAQSLPSVFQPTQTLLSRSAWPATSVQGQRARRDRLDHWGAQQVKLAARVCVQHCVDADNDSNPGVFWVFAKSKIVFPV